MRPDLHSLCFYIRNPSTITLTATQRFVISVAKVVQVIYKLQNVSMTEPCAMQNQNASHLVRAVETEKSENAISKQNPSRDAELETLRSQGSQNASSLLSCTSKFIAIKGWKRAWVYLA